MTDAARLRLGVLGCGRVFERFHLPALRRSPAVALVAAADPDPARLTWSAGASESLRRCVSADELFGLELDAVLVLTPPTSHAELCLRALEAGCHVLVEKPMARSVADGRRIADAARRAGRVVQVGFARRFRPAYGRLRAALDGASATQSARLVSAGTFDLSFSTAGWNAHSRFLGDAALGGGVLDDVLSHQVDLVTWLLGPVSMARAVAEDGEDGAVTAELRMPGLVMRCRAAHGTYVERLVLELEDGRGLEASGSHLRIARASSRRWGRSRARLFDDIALVRDKLLRRPNASQVSFERQIADFAARIRGEPARGATAEEAVRGLEVLEACRASMGEGGAWATVA